MYSETLVQLKQTLIGCLKYISEMSEINKAYSKKIAIVLIADGIEKLYSKNGN